MENFVAHGAGGCLVKAAYTGIAASLIGEKMLHVVVCIPVKGNQHQSACVKRKLTAFWADKLYLIVDEVSMVGRAFLAKLSCILSIAKSGSGGSSSDKAFGGLHVIIIGDFHQFPPVANRKSAPLFWPCNTARDTTDEQLGRKIYEEFTVVVQLKEQVRVTDPEWHDLLQYVRYGNCRKHHIELLCSLIVTNPNCPPTDFGTAPWNSAVLITPHHAVRMQWNVAMGHEFCKRTNSQLFVSPAYDTIHGRLLTLEEHFAVTMKLKKGSSQRARGGLPNEVELAIRLKMMVTFNVETEPDVANRVQGEIVDKVLDKRETVYSEMSARVTLQFPPAYVFVKLDHTKVAKLETLEQGVLPITPMQKTFSIHRPGGEKKIVTRSQLPLTSTYAFTDYRSQGQTISHSIIDTDTPPSVKLTPCNAYVVLSRGHGKAHIHLLRDFDECLFTTHPCEHLRVEDERLERLDKKTRIWWEEKQKVGM